VTLDAPLLRGIDAAGRAAIGAAAIRTSRRAGELIYRDGDAADSLFVVATGAIELRAIRRGDDAASVVRVARPGDSFGDEAILPGLPRRATAIALVAATVDEVPIAVVQRALARAGTAGEREGRYVQRAAARDLLGQTALGRQLGEVDTELLLDGTRLERFARGVRIFEPGDRADAIYLVVEGLVQLQRDDGDRTSVSAYLARGDVFGDDEALRELPRGLAAVAAGDTWCAIVPRAVARTLGDRTPGLFAGLRRVAQQRDAGQAEVVGDAAARSTQHVFRDLYRMQMARSLLVIDQDSCVRCGHCAWSCADSHADQVSRLIRRGDKVVTSLAGQAATLLLPNTCQHCRHAACMIDCPTGAIGRDPEGEVFIRADLCTGCGNCVRACPWDNVQLALRPAAAAGATGATGKPSTGSSAAVAVKCDLCRGLAAPACVEACPTGALTRLDPMRDVAEVAAVLGRAPTAAAVTSAATTTAPTTAATTTAPTTAATTPPTTTTLARQAREAARSSGAALLIALALIAAAAGARFHDGAGARVRLAAGVIAGLALLGLAAYVLPKRFPRRRARDRHALGPRPVPRSRTRLALAVHVVVGALVPAAVLLHAGAALRPTPAGALLAAFAAVTGLGMLGALGYRGLPRALTRIERRGDLPEDLAGAGEELRVRLVAALTDGGELVKRVAERVLLPYAGARLGWVALVASRRGLVDEERRLRRAIDDGLGGRGGDRLAGLDRIIRLAVELRALTGRRVLTAALRVWLPAHMVAAAVALALLALHVVLVLAW